MLTQLLDGPGPPEDAAAAIVGMPALLSELRRELPHLEAVGTRKAGEDGVKAVIGRRLSLYPQPKRSEAEWTAWWADYFDALVDVPLVALEAAMRAYVASPEAEFMPKPGKLRALAWRAPSRTLHRLGRARLAVRLADQRAALG